MCFAIAEVMKRLMLRVITNNEMRRTTKEVVVAVSLYLYREHFRDGLREDVKNCIDGCGHLCRTDDGTSLICAKYSDVFNIIHVPQVR